MTIKDTFPVPKVNEIFDQLSNTICCTNFDFKSDCFQVSLAIEDRKKSGFSIRDNWYQFTALRQGITNGTASF